MTKGERAGEKMGKIIVRLTDLMAHNDAEDFYRGLDRIFRAEMRLRMMEDEKVSQDLPEATRKADTESNMR